MIDVATTETYLRRIAELDGKIGAFIYTDAEAALASAQAAKSGPLAGVTVAVKDHLTITGMPTPRAGSEIDISDLIEPEGSFVKSLRRAGCVIVGKTRATEFAFGTFNLERRTPWNPCDPSIARMPGGSSNGSATAVAAGMCAFAIGTDTGGSVRQPAAMCGIVGYKSTWGMWAIDGVFPLSPSLDSIGTLARSASDSAEIFRALTRLQTPPVRLRGLRFGRPSRVFYDDLDKHVAGCMDEALARLRSAGVEIVDVELPDLRPVDEIFAKMVPADLASTLGEERITKNKAALDPVTRSRIDGGLTLSAIEYITLSRRCVTFAKSGRELMRGFDGWITPTAPSVPIPVADVTTVDAAAAWNRRALRNTRPANAFAQCGISLPITHLGSPLPVGLQLLGACGDDAKLLSIACAVEELLGAATQG